jgi:hypothetical protein
VAADAAGAGVGDGEASCPRAAASPSKMAIGVIKNLFMMSFVKLV